MKINLPEEHEAIGLYPTAQLLAEASNNEIPVIVWWTKLRNAINEGLITCRDKNGEPADKGTIASQFGIRDPHVRSGDLGDWLSARGHKVSYCQIDMKSPNKHVPKLVIQENIILQVLEELNYDPQNIPPNSPGRKGARGEVWDKIVINNEGGKFLSKSNYMNIWQQMRTDKLLKP